MDIGLDGVDLTNMSAFIKAESDQGFNIPEFVSKYNLGNVPQLFLHYNEIRIRTEQLDKQTSIMERKVQKLSDQYTELGMIDDPTSEINIFTVKRGRIAEEVNSSRQALATIISKITNVLTNEQLEEKVASLREESKNLDWYIRTKKILNDKLTTEIAVKQERKDYFDRGQFIRDFLLKLFSQRYTVNNLIQSVTYNLVNPDDTNIEETRQIVSKRVRVATMKHCNVKPIILQPNLANGRAC